MNKDKLQKLLATAYQQGFNNGYCDAKEGLDNISWANDWVKECWADGEIAEISIFGFESNTLAPLNLNELLTVVTEMKNHWVGKYLARAFISCYSGKKLQIDLRLFNNLDYSNRDLFIQILNMRTYSSWNDENLYQCELRLKKIVGIK